MGRDGGGGRVLERWLDGYEQTLAALQRAWVQFPPPMVELTLCSSGSEGSSILFWSPRAQGTRVIHHIYVQTYMQQTIIHVNNKIMSNGTDGWPGWFIG